MWLAELFGLSEFTVAEYTFNRWSKKGNVELEIAFTSKQVASEWSARAEFLSIHFERIPTDVISPAQMRKDVRQACDRLLERGWVVEVPPSTKDLAVYYTPRPAAHHRYHSDKLPLVVLGAWYKGKTTPAGGRNCTCWCKGSCP